MSDFVSSRELGLDKNSFVTRTFAWMFAALLISAVTALATVMALAVYPPFLKLLFGNHCIGFVVLAVGELGLVWYLSSHLRELSVRAASLCFIAYAVINGITLSSVFLVYSIASIALAFLGTALMFGFMSVYGSVTKANLATAGHYLMMGLVGLLIVSGVNLLVGMFTHIRLGWLDWAISFATVIIFAGLTAYDTQRIMLAAGHSDNSDAYKKIAVYGALQLYLDFINIFLSLLRLFGRRR